MPEPSDMRRKLHLLPERRRLVPAYKFLLANYFFMLHGARQTLLLGLLLALSAMVWKDVTANGAEPANTVSSSLNEQRGIEFFEKKIRPLLVQHCYKCHSQEGETKGGLQVDCRESIRKGGESGAAIVPFKPDESLLLAALAHDGSFYNMPPSGALPPQLINDLRTWISLGAPDPRDRPATSQLAWDQVLAERRAWWSLQPRTNPQPPPVRDAAWSQQPVDRFLQARWEAAGIQPAPLANKHTLLLRLHFILTGLPPTADEAETFLNDESPEAYSRLVDRLLASPQFGERWARHWMDLVRYKETHGSEHDPVIPHAWRYRDYLIRALNDDLPYDRFVQEQLAGDRLTPRRDRVTGWNECLTATAYFRFVEFYPTPVDVKAEEITVVDAQIDSFSKTFQALTISCARCHDHKFDAVSARDYYALYGIFAGTRTTMHALDDPAVLHAHDDLLKAQLPAIRAALADLWSRDLETWPNRIAAARQRLADKEPLPTPKVDDITKPELQWVGISQLDRDALALREAQQQVTSPLFAIARTAQLKQDPKTVSDSTAWKQIQTEVARSTGEFSFRNAKRYRLFADFTHADAAGWYRAEQSFHAAKSGTLIVQPTRDFFVSGVVPRGLYSHLLSDKHAGSLRSPNFTLDMQSISVLAGGTNKARLRLVIENFQGDELLFRPVAPKLSDSALRWQTMPIRPNWVGRRAYLEAIPRDDMTYVGKLTDASQVERVDGRSGIGVRAVVFHNDGRAPDLEPTLSEAYWQQTPQDGELVSALVDETRAALTDWRNDRADDRQALLLDTLARIGLLSNTAPADHAASRAVAEYRAIEDRVPLPHRMPGVADEEGIDERLFPRGDYRTAKETVSRGYLEALESADYAERQSGRLRLAQHLTSPEHPLTARVMVNRVWRHVFGEGLVRTVDNFGQLGEQPSHPELLDWLANHFIDEGWSLKQLMRMLLTSRAFQSSAEADRAARDRDPENRLWSHALIRRLDAEAIRDRLLWASTRGDGLMYGVSVPLPVNQAYKDFDVPLSGPLDGAGRRSVYLEMRHNYPPALLSAFDQPRAVDTIGRRDTTNVPAQSLALLNDPFVRDQAERLAKYLLRANSADDTARLQMLYQRVLCRQPSLDELRHGEAFLRECRTGEGRGAKQVDTELQAWSDLAHALFNFKEFIYLR